MNPIPSFTIHIYSFGFNDDHVFCFKLGLIAKITILAPWTLLDLSVHCLLLAEIGKH